MKVFPKQALFCLHQRNKPFASKVKIREVSSYCKGAFEAGKLGYANRTKKPITYPKCG